MKQCPNFESIVVVQRFASPNDTSNIPQTERLESFLSSSSTAAPIVRVGFQDPMVIYYSSGTTGTPKAIVHGVGPLLLTVHKEGVLHRDLGHDDVCLQYTTTGWIMYLASVGQMVFGSRAIFYDGSPFIPDLSVLLRVVAEQKVSMLGVNPRWLGELMKNNIVPKKEVDLSSLKAVGSTGMVLKEIVFEWFYDVGFPKDVKLGNFSGGTDIVSCPTDLKAKYSTHRYLRILGWLLRHREPPYTHLRGRMSRRCPRNPNRHLSTLSTRRQPRDSRSLRHIRRPRRDCCLPQCPALSLERHNSCSG